MRALTLGWRSRLSTLGLIWILAVGAAAQDRPPSLEEVAAQLVALTQDSALDEARRAELTQRWKAVQGLIETAVANRAQVAAWQAEEADARAAAATGSVPGVAPSLPPSPAPGASRATYEEALAGALQLIADADARLAEINTRQGERSGRKPELATRLAEARAALDAARAEDTTPRANEAAPNGGGEVGAPGTPGATQDPGASANGAPSSALLALQDAERRARIDELESRVALLEVDLAGFDLRGETLERRAKSWATLKQDATARRVELERQIQAAREREAKQAETDAQARAREVAGNHVVLQAIARRNGELAEQRAKLLESSRKLQGDAASAHAELESLDARMAATKRRDALADGGQSIGSVLRRERQALPDLRQLEQRLGRYARELTELRLSEFDLNERQRELRLPRAALSALVSEAEGAPELDETATALALELLDIQGRLLTETLDELSRTVSIESDLEATESNLLTSAREFKAFIDERVLWVRSTEPLWRFDLRAFGNALAFHANPKNWTDIPLALSDGVASNPGWAIVYVLAVAGLFALRGWLRKRDAASDPALRSVHIGPTFGALARDLLAAAVWPVVVGVPAWVLIDSTNGDGASGVMFPRAVATGALAVIAPMYVLAFVRRLTRTGGTGELYFGWGQPNTRLLRRVVVFGAPVYLAAMFAAAVVQATGKQAWSDTLGRLGFMAAMATMLVGLRMLLREKGLATPPRYRDEESWVASLRPLWNLIGVGGALALLGLSVLGFDYTARQLHVPFERSLALMLAMLVTQAVAFRWLLLARRRIQLEQARARREADEDTKEAEGEELPDLRTLGLELRRAVRAAMAILALVGLYWTWRNEIPALGALDRIRLYPFSPPIEGEFEFTASKLLVVILAVFATGAVARRLPGLLDFLLLDRTGFTAAERYAVRSVTQYVVVTLGVLIALSQVGITWSQLQWLAAAVSVGLGFGLQEIFANFVSGLILLFERPIRVGDLVTINGMEGRVTNIRIRATTILDFDRRELIVPNREFVTGSLINWTLSDPITRVTIPVGVSYGSDVALVHRLLMQAAREVPVVLREPKPHTVFRHFGDSSLDFELRIYLGDRDHWLDAVNGARDRITTLFRENGVEIPFPQRDLHIVSAKPLVEVLGGSRRS